MEQTLVQINNLKTYFFTDAGVVKAVDDVSLHILKGKTLAVVGESGSGKSVMASSIMRLIPQPPGKIVAGEILFNGEDLLKKSEVEMRSIRGDSISMIFQEPMTSLNPVFKIGEQITEAIELHQNTSEKEAFERAVELLRLVGIPAAKERMKDYPHQLSGGMRQRVMIAMALACNPELLIADEPTTALDVTIQAQILELMRRLQAELGMAILLITHDLGVVAEMADEVVVMYAGQVMEYSDVNRIFSNPLHPYTAGLMRSIPRIDVKQDKLYVIEGVVPNPTSFPKGCRFAPRCPLAEHACKAAIPELREITEGHYVRCIKAGCTNAGG